MKRYLGVWLVSVSVLFGCVDLGDEPIDVHEANQELTASYSPSAAVQYALGWTTQGGVKRNPQYPDFGIDDCTNFVSQAAKAGGVAMTGTGGCGYQNTTTQWYAYKNPGCTANPTGFELTTSWSRVADFWTFHTTHGAANRVFTSGQLSDIRAKAQLGDIIQGGRSGNWMHSMIITTKSAYEVYVTYHSGLGGLDVVNRSFGDVAYREAYTDYRLISFYHSIP